MILTRKKQLKYLKYLSSPLQWHGFPFVGDLMEPVVSVTRYENILVSLSATRRVYTWNMNGSGGIPTSLDHSGHHTFPHLNEHVFLSQKMCANAAVLLCAFNDSIRIMELKTGRWAEYFVSIDSDVLAMSLFENNCVISFRSGLLLLRFSGNAH